MRCKICGDKVGFLSWVCYIGKCYYCEQAIELIKIDKDTKKKNDYKKKEKIKIKERIQMIKTLEENKK